MLTVVLDGLTPYGAAHALQEALVEARRAGQVPDLLLLLEHEETITLGRRPAEDGVVDAGGVPVVRIERGGFATWHGPGQLVGYPIVALDGDRRDVHRHLHALESGVIDLLGGLGLEAGRDTRNTGVWVGGLKICSVGIAIRQWVSWHGLALNVHNDLGGFARIRPCGFGPEVMTRLSDHLDPCPALAELQAPLAAALTGALGLEPGGVARSRLASEADVGSVLGEIRRAGSSARV